MADFTAVPATAEDRDRILREAAREGMTPAAYISTLLHQTRREPKGKPMTEERDGGTDYFSRMKEMAEMAPMLMMMRSMGMSPENGGSSPLTRRDLEEILSRRRSRSGDEEDEEESPMARRINKLMMRRLDLQMYLKLLGEDSTEGKYVKDLIARQDEELRTIRAGQEALEKTLEEEKVKTQEARMMDALARKDEAIAELRNQLSALAQRLDTPPAAPPSFGAQVRELAESLISAKKAFAEAENGLRGPTTPPEEGGTVDKIGYFLDKGAAAAKDILQGMGYVQAGQHGVPPESMGHVPMPPPLEETEERGPPSPPPGPMAPPAPPSSPMPPVRTAPAADPVTVSVPPPPVMAPASAPIAEPATAVYLDGAGRPISKEEWSALNERTDVA